MKQGNFETLIEAYRKLNYLNHFADINSMNDLRNLLKRWDRVFNDDEDEEKQLMHRLFAAIKDAAQRECSTYHNYLSENGVEIEVPFSSWSMDCSLGMFRKF